MSKLIFSEVGEPETPSSGKVVFFFDSADGKPKYKDDTGSVFDFTPTVVFGSEFQEEESLGLSSTTSETPQTKLEMITPVLPAGKYRIGWTYTWAHSAGNTDFEGFINLNGTNVRTHSQEPKDQGTDQNHICSGFVYEDLANQAHTIQINYSTEDSDDTAFISEARLEIWRVS